MRGLDHGLVALSDQRIHFVRAPGRGREPLPLLLTHGWPGSFCEYLAVLDLLSDPAASGDDEADSFTVIAPSLPGFAFSSPPPTEGLNAGAIAELWHRLMTDVLGYSHYVAHGSDLGVGVTARLARAHPEAVLGIHLATPGLPAPPRPWSSAEERHFADIETWAGEEGGYAHMHATKPSTLTAALHDSPVGLAAWIGEKISAWSSTTSNGASRFAQRASARHPHALLGNRHDRLVAAALLDLPSRPRQRTAARRPVAGTNCDEHLRRRTRPISKAATRARRALLHDPVMG